MFGKLTCPIVVGLTLGDIKCLNWCLTSLLNPTNSRYAPLKPHLHTVKKKKLTFYFRTWTTYPVVLHTVSGGLFHLLFQTVTCNTRLLRYC